MLLLNPSDYTLIETSDVTCKPIKKKEECEKAARQLGLSDIKAGTRQDPVHLDPPYCYFEGNGTKEYLAFNADGINTGECGATNDGWTDKCLCHNTYSSILPGPPLVCSEGLCRQYRAIEGKTMI